MRIKTLMQYYASTIKRAVIIFYAFFAAGTLMGSILTSVSETVIMGMQETHEDGSSQTWSISIFAFLCFILIVSLIMAQKDTRFLITRSVARKEIFTSYSLFLLPLSLFMTLLQILTILWDGAIRAIISGGDFRGLGSDFQIFQAANSDNPAIFFLVSFSMIFSIGALGYLLGTCFGKWKIQTIAVLAVGFITFFTCLMLPDFQRWVIDSFTYMFTDDQDGLWIVAKQLVATALFLAISFPVMRRITAAKNG